MTVRPAPDRAGGRAVWIIQSLVLLAVSPGCAEHEPAEPAQPNVLLIVVDTVRWDHVGCYGSLRSNRHLP